MYKVELYVRVRRASMVEGTSTREAARVFGLHRDTLRKMLRYSAPPGYRRRSPPPSTEAGPLPGHLQCGPRLTLHLEAVSEGQVREALVSVGVTVS